jgi:hypothetical protein
MAKLGPDYYKLNRTGRILYLSGVPLSYLRNPVDPSGFSFQNVSLTRKDKSLLFLESKRQADFFKVFQGSIKNVGASSFYGVGSFPTEQASYEFGAYISNLFFETSFTKTFVPSIKWVDLGSPDWSYLKDLDVEYHLVVLHGMADTSDPKRFEIAKDFLRRADSSTVLLLATTENIITFCEQRLSKTPDGVWQLNRKTHRVAV